MTQPIRVLQVVNAMGMGGAENFIMNVYRTIDKSKVQFDFAVHTKEPGVFDEEIKKMGGRIFYFEKFNGVNFFQYKSEWQNFFKKHPEIKVIHGHLGSSAAIYLDVAKKNHVYAIAHSHNVSENNWKNPKNIVWEAASYPTRYIAQTRFACGMEAGKSRYGKKFEENIETDDQVVQNGILVDKYAFSLEKRTAYRKEMGVSDDTFVVGHVGRFEYQKNHTFLLDIFNEIHILNPNSQLWLIGEGTLKEEMIQKVKDLNLETSVKFLGLQKDTPPIYMAMDLFLMPSLFEGLPVSLIEAQASGLKGLVSDTIDKKADVSNSLTFYSLDKSPEKWGEKALTLKTPVENRPEGAVKVRQAGYSVEEISVRLMNFYLDHSNNERREAEKNEKVL